MIFQVVHVLLAKQVAGHSILSDDEGFWHLRS